MRCCCPNRVESTNSKDNKDCPSVCGCDLSNLEAHVPTQHRPWKVRNRPLLIAMMAVGLYTEPKWKLMKVHMLSIFLFAVFGFARCLPTFRAALDLTQISMCYSLVTVCFSALYVWLNLWNKLAPIFEKLDENSLYLRTLEETLEISDENHSVTKKLLNRQREKVWTWYFVLYVVVSLLQAAVGCGFMAYLFSFTTVLDSLFYPLNIFFPPENGTAFIIIKRVSAMWSATSTFIWILPYIFILMLLAPLGQQFSCLHMIALARLGPSSDGEQISVQLSPGQFESLLMAHRRFANILQEVDSYFGVQHLISMAYGLCVICMMVYNLFLAPDSDWLQILPSRLAGSMWLVCSVFCICAPLFLGAWIQDRALSLLPLLSHLRPSQLSDTDFRVLTVFFSEMTHTTPGITCAGLFVLNKDSILTVLGVLVTYVVVVMQLPNGQSCH